MGISNGDNTVETSKQHLEEKKKLEEIQSWDFEIIPGILEARRCQSRDLKLIPGTPRLVCFKIVDDKSWKYIVSD